MLCDATFQIINAWNDQIDFLETAFHSSLNGFAHSQ